MKNLLYYGIFFLVMFTIFLTACLFINRHFPMIDVLIFAGVSTFYAALADYKAQVQDRNDEKNK